MAEIQNFIRRRKFLTVSACIMVGISAPHAFAGFEWVPQKTAPKPEMSAPVAVVEPLDADDKFLPLPGDEELADPVIVIPAPEPEMTQEITPVMPAPAAPTRLSVMPKEEPNSGAVMLQAKEDTVPPAELTPIMFEEPMIESDDPTTLKKPPFEITNTRIIVPEDAPANAVAYVEKKNAKIVAFPSDADLKATQEQPITIINPEIATSVTPDTMYENAVGFAEDVPLALALRQVVPADFAFSFGKNVNPGLRVSWNGGKPWNEVVADMVGSIGYAAKISKKTVLVMNRDSAMAPSEVTPMLIEPAAGAEEAAEEMVEIERERSIKRANIIDPGGDTLEKPGLIDKVAHIFGSSDNDDTAVKAASDAAEVMLPISQPE